MTAGTMKAARTLRSSLESVFFLGGFFVIIAASDTSNIHEI
ncbi:hypothetical protein TR2A62_2477 [Thalassobium sp. R2A62]|nr:hypothetical protein TR2A62_2477 [Thalassobium sp. R2A62]